MAECNTHGGLIGWFVHNPVAANLIMLTLLIAGSCSLLNIKKEIYPDTKSDVIEVSIGYPGAAPEDVEQGVVRQVEEVLQGVEGVKNLLATAAPEEGRFSLVLLPHTDPVALMDAVRQRIATIDSFPEAVETPQIRQAVERNELLWLILHGPLEQQGMGRLAEEIKGDVAQLSGAGLIEIHGRQQEDLHIEVAPSVLVEYDLTLTQIAAALRNQSLDLPGGAIDSDSGSILLRSLGKAFTRSDFEDLIIRSHEDGSQLRLGDVARVSNRSDGHNFLFFNNEQAIALQVFASDNANPVELANRIKEYLKARSLPHGVALEVVVDMAVHLNNRMELMLKNMLFGTLLVFGVLALFLRIRIAFWVMLGLPVCFLGTLWLMPMLGVSINMLTLYGFILVLGILVDDAIVIGESICTAIDSSGGGEATVIQGARAVATPATYGVLTTVVAFIPLLIIPGEDGPLWAGIAYVVIMSLLLSLFESKFLLPVHLRHIGPSAGHGQCRGLAWLRLRLQQLIDSFLERCYRPLLTLFITYRYATLAACGGILLITLVALQTGVIRWIFFPRIDTGVVLVTLQLDERVAGGRLEQLSRQLEQLAVAVNASFLAAGEKTAPLGKRIAYSESEHNAQFYVELSPSAQRHVTPAQIIQRWQRAAQEIASLPEVTQFVFSTPTESDEEAAVSFDITGRQLIAVDEVVDRLKQALAGYQGVYNIRDSRHQRQPEIQISLQPGASQLGVTLEDVATQVRESFHGIVVQSLQQGDSSVDVVVLSPWQQRRHLADLEALTIVTAGGERLPLTAVARLQEAQGAIRIERKNGRRVITLKAAVDDQMTDAEEIMDELLATVGNELQANYPGVQISVSGAAQEEQHVLQAIIMSSLLALLAIYALMAVPLKSYLQPLMIMMSIPFGMVGAVLGHLLLDLPISILSLCGCIALAGVVVNDALVLITSINANSNHCTDLCEVLRVAGCSRFRAILLTSLTTFCGLLPMVMERSLQAQFLIPMAVSLAFGILFSTLITLFLIPVLYVCLEDIKQLCSRLTETSPAGEPL